MSTTPETFKIAAAPPTKAPDVETKPTTPRPASPPLYCRGCGTWHEDGKASPEEPCPKCGRRRVVTT